MITPRFRQIAPLVGLILAAGLPLLADSSPIVDQRLAGILARFDEVQDSFTSLSADFSEITINPLMKEPIVSEGHFFMTKPDSIRWEYVQPEEMSFVIASDQYTGYFPAQKRAEKRSIRRWSGRIFRFIGLGQASDELSKFYNIRLATDDENDDPREGVHLLIFEPKKRRIKKRMTEVRFWISEANHLPVKVEYVGKNGNSRTIDFHEIRLNPDLAAGLYTVDLPSDVQVTTGFSGLPGFGDVEAN